MKQLYYTLLFVLQLFTSIDTYCQMYIDRDTLLGFEWIDSKKPYFSLSVTQDGLYSISATDLNNMGINLPEGMQWQLFHMGREVPIYVSNENFDSEDQIIFWGRQNRNDLDSLLFIDRSAQLNPRYSLISDTSNYYLTWTNQEVNRWETNAVTSGMEEQPAEFIQKQLTIDSFVTFYKYYDKIIRQRVYDSEFNSLTGFGSSALNRHTILTELDDYHHIEDSTITFGIRMATNFLSDPPSISKIDIHTTPVDTLELKSFELFESEYEVSGIANGRFQIVIEGLVNNQNPELIIASYWYKYRGKLQLIDNRTTYTNANEIYSIKLSDANATDYLVFDILNRKFSIIPSTENSLQYTHNYTGGNFYIQPFDEITPITEINPVDFKIPQPNRENNFIFLTSKKLYNQTTDNNPIDEYVSYRRSEEGGNYKTHLLFIEDLYDIYSYGIHRHPFAIINLVEHFYRHNPNTNVLIIGKGRPFSNVRLAEDLANPLNESYYVPSYGFPASDALLFSSPGRVAPKLAHGRLAVNHIDQVSLYLNNLKQYEQFAPAVPTDKINWKKRIIHLSGGNSLANLIRGKLNNMNDNIQKTNWAPEVISFYKNGTSPVDSNKSEAIYQTINEGISMATFFGHGSPVALGFKIDNISQYNNAPLLPLFFVLGCSAGDYNTPLTSVSEIYCLMENRGFLNLISSSTISEVFNLSDVGVRFYGKLGDNIDHISNGEALRQTIESLESSRRRAASQLQLFGDPSIKIHAPKEYDIRIDESSVKINPTYFSAEQESFNLNFDIINDGLTPPDSLAYEVYQLTPNSSLKLIESSKINIIGYRHSLQVSIPLNTQEDAGINRLFIRLDPEDEIEELLYSYSENNNEYVHGDGTVGFPLFIPSSNLIPLWPRDESIIPSNDVIFYTTSGDILSPENSFYFELDTTINFNSNLLVQEEARSTGGVIKFLSDDSLIEDQVYYWRVSPAPDAATGAYYWSPIQSFIVLPNQTGWNNSHYYQFLSMEKQGIFQETDRKWVFDKEFISIRFGNGIWNSADRSNIGWYEQNNPILDRNRRPWRDHSPGLCVMSFSHNNNHFMNSGQGDYGSLPIDEERPYFLFPNSSSGRDSLIHFIDQVIPESHSVIFFTVRNDTTDYIYTTDWATDSIRNDGKNIYNILENYGSNQIRNIHESGHYVFRFSKSSGVLFEALTTEQDETITDEFTISQINRYGLISLENNIINKPNRHQLEWKIYPIPDSSNQINIYYQNPDSSNQHTLVTNKWEGVYDLYNVAPNDLSSTIIYAEFIEDDAINPNPPQISHFRIYGTVIGDFAIAPNKFISLPQKFSTLGEKIKWSVQVQRINHEQNSIPYRVDYIRNEDNNIVISKEGQLVFSSESIILSDSASLQDDGNYRIELTINPNKDFSEASFINNFLILNTEILSDNAPPNINCRFDGLAIENRQLVSPNAEIIVELIDEQQYSLLNDSALLDVEIIQPNGSVYEISPDNTSYIFPQSGDNRLQLKINGSFEQNGIYKLSASGNDNAGNRHDVDYQINFKIETRAGATVTLHPNPTNGPIYLSSIVGGKKSYNMIVLIYNDLGQLIKQERIELKPGTQVNQLETEGLITGKYYYEIVGVNSDDQVITQPSLLENLGSGNQWKGYFIYLKE